MFCDYNDSLQSFRGRAWGMTKKLKRIRLEKFIDLGFEYLQKPQDIVRAEDRAKLVGLLIKAWERYKAI
jgi:hypothetical protein